MVFHILSQELNREWAVNKYISNFIAFVVILCYGFWDILNDLPIIKEMKIKSQLTFFIY